MGLDRRVALVAGLVTMVLAGCYAGASFEASPAITPAPTMTAVIATPTATAPAATEPSPSMEPTPTPVPTPTLVPTLTPGPTWNGTCDVPMTVHALSGAWNSAWPIEVLVNCLGDRELQVTGYLEIVSGVGGPTTGVAPAWLGEWFGVSAGQSPVVLWGAAVPADGRCTGVDSECEWMFLFAPDPSALDLTLHRWVRVTGHYDDPVAQTCHLGNRIGMVSSDAEAVATCRRHFVVTAIVSSPAATP
jgi:hypothetical protein